MDVTELRSLAYEAAVVPERWIAFVDAAAMYANAKGGVLSTIRHLTEFSIHSQTLEPMWKDFVAGGWAERDSFMQRAIASGETHFQHDGQLFTEAEKLSDDWYCVFCQKWDVGGSLGTMLSLPSNGMALLTLKRSKDAGPYTAADVDKFNLIRADLGRSVVLTSELLFTQYQTTTQVLQTIGIPGAVVSAKKRLLAANTLFEALIPHLVQDKADGIHLVGAADRMLASALDGLNPGDWDNVVASFPVVPTKPGQQAAIVHVLPLRGAAHDIIHGAAAIILVSVARTNLAPSHHMIKELFDLTPAESRIASHLVRHAGRYGEISTELCVSRETVRSQSKAVYQKMGLEGAADLIALVTRLNIPLGPG